MQSGNEQFLTTRWTLILEAAGDPGDGKQHALEEFCLDYWKPVYAYVRRHGYDHESAGDLTQGFFARLLEKDWLAGVENNGTPFRAFLLVVLKRYLAGAYRKDHAVKRGGMTKIASLDWSKAPIVDTTQTPDEAFDLHWALSAIDLAIARLRAEAEASGKLIQFDVVAPFLTDSGESRAAAAATIGLSDGALSIVIHRQRMRLRELIRSVVTETLADKRGVDEEVKYLMEALRQ